jgi:hypothetical protein
MKSIQVKVSLTLLLVISLLGCATPGETTGNLRGGQWSPTRNVGQDKFLVEGYDTEDAIAGATEHCVRRSKRFDAISIVPHSRNDRATITFTCR